MGFTVDGGSCAGARASSASGLAFDPVVVGTRECAALVAYYRRDWARFLVNAVGMVRGAFRLNPLDTLRGAWWVLRANQVWSPPTGNDPARAQDFMARFYRLLRRGNGTTFDPDRAAELEVVWWAEHRRAQRAGAASDPSVREALAAVYTHVFDVPLASARRAADLRIRAIDFSDRWAATDLDPHHQLVQHERRYLVASYTALAETVGPHHGVRFP